MDADRRASRKHRRRATEFYSIIYLMSDLERMRRLRIRRSFARAAAQYEHFAVLSREVSARMLERLALVQQVPQRVLDLGSGTGMAARALAQRYPRAQIIALDISLPMLHQQSGGGWRRAWRVLGGGQRPSVCADFERLPIATGTIDMVISNLALHWAAGPGPAFAETSRVLRPGGLFMFTTFGPDTLRELAQASAEGSAGSPVHSFIDMHDLGDALLASGLSDPVMEMEQIILTYADFDGLVRDLRGTGTLSLRPARGGLRTPRWKARVAQRYEALRRDGRLPATFEVVYGHAWKIEARSARPEDGVSVIRFHQRPRAM
jgi:malonyl-CoA O-methyltransferase